MRIISVRMEPDVWMVTTVTHVTVYLGTLVRVVAINVINIQSVRIFLFHFCVLVLLLNAGIFTEQTGPWWLSGNILTSHLWGQQCKPRTLCGKVGRCLPMVSCLQYTTLTICMYTGWQRFAGDSSSSISIVLHLKLTSTMILKELYSKEKCAICLDIFLRFRTFSKQDYKD